MTKIFTYSPKFTNLARKYKIVDDLYEGTETIRRNGEFYLPKEAGETQINYNNRLQRSVLFNAFKDTVDTSVGKMFTKPMNVKINDERLKLFIENVDGYGTSLESFTKEITREAIKSGIAYILVDYPKVGPDVTLADEINLIIAPYWLMIRATQVMDVKVDYEDRNAVVTFFKFKEFVSTIENGVETEKEQVRIFRKNGSEISYEVWVMDKKNEVLRETGVISGIDLIPVVPVYGNKISHFIGSPTLYDLAELNILHYKAYSDYMNIVHVVQCPMLVVKGYQPQLNPDGTEKPFVISPNSVFILPSESGDVKYVEVAGGSVAAGKELILDIENKIKILGLELITQKPGGSETATGRIIDAAQQSSKLKSIAIDVEDSITTALFYTAVYMKLENIEISVNIDNSYTVLNNNDVTQLIELYKNGIIDSATVLEEIRKRALISPAQDA
jgi:hypothetical protein